MFYAGTFYGIIPVRHARQGSSDHFWNFQYTAGTGMTTNQAVYRAGVGLTRKTGQHA